MFRGGFAWPNAVQNMSGERQWERKKIESIPEYWSEMSRCLPGKKESLESLTTREISFTRSCRNLSALIKWEISPVYWNRSFVQFREFKCYCQKKPGNSKRSGSAVYLHVFTVWKLSEKINNHGIWRSSRSIFFEISLFRDFGTSGDLKKHKFWLTLGEVKTYLAKLPIVLIFFP